MAKLIYRDSLNPLDRPESFNLLLNKEPQPDRGWLLYATVFAVLVAAVVFWFAPRRHVPDPEGTERVVYRVQDADLAMLESSVELRRQAREAKMEEQEEQVIVLPPVPEGHVRVAAIQVHTRMGDVERNRTVLEQYLRRAAEHGTRIAVLPEAGLPGYADLETYTFWSRNPEADAAKEEELEGEEARVFRDVREVAQPRDGDAIQHFAALAEELEMYIVLPYIEREGEGDAELFYNAAVLLDPAGEAVLHYRKQSLWRIGDPMWAEPGAYDIPPTVETPYGRIGVMISYDMHTVFRQFAEQRVDIILHVAAFYGMNFEEWLLTRYRRLARASGANVILANWALPWPGGWEGYGLSRILRRDGRLLASRTGNPGEYIVIHDIPLPGTAIPDDPPQASASEMPDARGCPSSPIQHRQGDGSTAGELAAMQGKDRKDRKDCKNRKNCKNRDAPNREGKNRSCCTGTVAAFIVCRWKESP